MADPVDSLSQKSEAHRPPERQRPGSRELVRYPVHYQDATVADINSDALPSIPALRGMQLAYREQPDSEEETICYGRQFISVWLMISIIAAATLLLLAPLVPLYVALPASSIVVIVCLIRMVFLGEASIFNALLCLVLPPVVTTALFTVTPLLANRDIATALFTVLAVSTFLSHAKEPFLFLRDWILTFPRLKPATRVHPPRDIQLRLWDASARFLLIGAIVIGISRFNSSFAILAGLGACLLLSIQPSRLWNRRAPRFDLTTAIHYAERLFGYFLAYGKTTSGAAGVWYPHSSFRERSWTLKSLLLMMTLMTAAATSGFAMWDAPVVRPHFLKSFHSMMANEKFAFLISQQDKDTDWQRYFVLVERDASLPVADSVVLGPKVVRESDEFLEDALHSSTGLWLTVCVFGMFEGNPNLVWLPMTSLVIATLFSILFPLACFRPFLKATFDFESNVVHNLDNDGRSIWQWFVDRLRSSTHVAKLPAGDSIRESEHLFLGVSAVTDYPVLLHRQLLTEHCYIVGQTGSGKTSLGIMPLLIQLLRGDTPSPQATSQPDTAFPAGPIVPFAEPVATQSESPFEFLPDATPVLPAIQLDTMASDGPAVVVLDLKGDPALFHTVRAEAAAAGREFRFFTPERGLATHVFNPFSNFASESRTLLQLCQLILDALGLNHGEGYGRSYYTRQNREALFDALNVDPAPTTFKELSVILKSFRGRPNYPDIFELASTIHALTQYPQLETIEPVSDPEQSIHMPTVLEERQVVYFWLPAAIESITVREIGKLALFSLLTAAIDRQRRGEPLQQVSLVIDEFQRLAGENFSIILEQARSFGVSAIMANQTQASLKTPTIDLRPTVQTNTRVKMYFGTTDVEEIQELSTLSGQEVFFLKSFSERGSEYSVTRQQTLKNRLMVGDILAATDHPRRAILHVNRGSGYSQFGGLPTVVDCFHPISHEQYVERSTMRWPEMAAVPGTTSSDVDLSEIEHQRSKILNEEQEDALKGLFEKADAKFRTTDQS